VKVLYWPTSLEAGFKDQVYFGQEYQVTDVQLNDLHLPFTAEALAISIDVPLDAQSGTMTVFTTIGNVSSPAPIPVYPYPVIRSLEPARGPAGTTVKALGENLDNVAQVTIGLNSVVVDVDHIDSGTISFIVPGGGASGELLAITKKGNVVNTGLAFMLEVPSGVITTRLGTINGHTPTSDPIPIPPITNSPPRQVSAHAGSGELSLFIGSAPVQLPVLSIVSVGSNALKLSWPRSGAACVLESTGSFLGNSWMLITPFANENEIVVPQAGKQQFFRLRISGGQGAEPAAGGNAE
jgi:hypothetical protein